MNKARNAKPVVVAGGGIGGLACALGLARKGFGVIVLEQAEHFGEIDAGIQFAPNAWSALDALSVGERVKKQAVFIEHLLLMDGITGECVIDVPLDERFCDRYRNPYAVTHRSDIHSALLDACKTCHDLIDLRTNSRVRGFAIDDRGVSIDVDGDIRIDAAALVGADGARSVVREDIVGDGAPRISGHVCYRTVLSIDDMPHDLRWRAATLWAGSRTHVVHYPLRGWKLFELVATVIRDQVGTANNDETPAEEVLPLFGENCDKELELLQVPKTFRRWMLRFREPVEWWSEGPVALIGDAAHLMLHYVAQGAAMAMEDAVCLAAAADATDGDFVAAFARYQSMRLVRVSRVQISSRLFGLVSHAEGVGRLVRNDMYQGRSAERYYDALDWLFTAPPYVAEFVSR